MVVGAAVISAIGAVASAGTTIYGAVEARKEEKKIKKEEGRKRAELKEKEEEKRRARLAGLQRSEGTLTSSQGVMENASVGRKTLLGG